MLLRVLSAPQAHGALESVLIGIFSGVSSRFTVRTVRFTAGALLFGWAVTDSARILLTAAILRRARARCPELFDGELALKAVEEALKESVLLRD